MRNVSLWWGMLTVAVQGMNGNSAFSAQFCYEPKTAFKSKTNEKETKKKTMNKTLSSLPRKPLFKSSKCQRIISLRQAESLNWKVYLNLSLQA